jgi:tetratricopeptide (TPR) repeat protein
MPPLWDADAPLMRPDDLNPEMWLKRCELYGRKTPAEPGWDAQNRIDRRLFEQKQLGWARTELVNLLRLRKRQLALESAARRRERVSDQATAANDDGVTLHEAGDLPGARSRYEWARQLEQEVGGNDRELLGLVLFNLGVVAEDQGSNDQAVDYCRRSLAVRPDDHDAQFNLDRLTPRKRRQREVAP